MASQRTELLGHLLATQFGLEEAVAELERVGVPTDAARSQLQALGDLQRQIANAGPATLTSLRGEIAAAATASRAVAQQGRAASSADSVETALAAASARTRATVQRVAGDLFERRLLDPYLQFGSPEDEAEYHRREAERQQYIRRELAKGTPDGNYNAATATLAQIDDAGAHGADRSPDYARMRGDTVNAREDMLAAIRRAGPNPQEANAPARIQPAASESDLNEIAAAFRAAGVQPPPPDGTEPDGHGLVNVAMERGGNSASRST